MPKRKRKRQPRPVRRKAKAWSPLQRADRLTKALAEKRVHWNVTIGHVAIKAKAVIPTPLLREAQQLRSIFMGVWEDVEGCDTAVEIPGEIEVEGIQPS